jgi:hypothetical protein
LWNAISKKITTWESDGHLGRLQTIPRFTVALRVATALHQQSGQTADTNEENIEKLKGRNGQRE